MSEAPFVLRDPVPRQTTIRDPRVLMMIELGQKIQRGEKLTAYERAVSQSAEYHDAVRAEAARIKGEKKALIADTERQIVALDREKARMERAFEAYDIFIKGPFKLERPMNSVRHQLFDAITRHSLTKGNKQEKPESSAPADGALFLVEHNWAAAFAGAAEFAEGEFKLPFDDTWFEFRISGVPVLVYYSESANYTTGFMRFDTHWISWDDDNQTDATADLVKLVAAQVRAICIALDAEVVTKETVRTPDALNRSREKQGRQPLSDYHVVRLARREHPAPLPDDHDKAPGSRHRLHFVRGHWRRYPTHKTWIKWHLRGDPDLGFIDKHYRL